MQQGSVLLPCERIVRPSLFFQAVGTLPVVGHQLVVIAAGADDDTVVGSQFTLALLNLIPEYHVFRSMIVITGGLQVSYPLNNAGLYLDKMAGVAKNTRQMTRQRMQLSIEDEVAHIFLRDAAVAATGSQ